MSDFEIHEPNPQEGIAELYGPPTTAQHRRIRVFLIPLGYALLTDTNLTNVDLRITGMQGTSTAGASTLTSKKPGWMRYCLAEDSRVYVSVYSFYVEISIALSFQSCGGPLQSR